MPAHVVRIEAARITMATPMLAAHYARVKVSDVLSTGAFSNPTKLRA